ncbi:MAG TPA: fused MFS/spermidine synthase [Roseiflexaceae bacterium]|nr:fused MFS/spermidine synthase [Roseiflexaceae bacterium]
MVPSETWQTQNLAAIHARLAPLVALPDGTIHEERSPLHQIRLIKHLGQIHFYFVDAQSGELVGPMSRIALDRPLHLLAEYTQSAMLALLWRREIARACVLGLAGGRLSLLLHHHVQHVVIDNVDIDAASAPLAERFFGLAFDARQRFVAADARAFLEASESTYDIIVLDAFSDHSDELDHLATQEFYQLCRERLARGGVFCANLLTSDPRFLVKSKTLLENFRFVYAAEHKRGVMLLGNDQRRLAPAEIARSALLLQKQHTFDFPFVERAAELRPARELPVFRTSQLRNVAILRDA